jgi:hypothetical protein
MFTVHMICGRSIVVMMRCDRALAGHATCGLVGRPCGARKRGVEQNDREQACNGRKRTCPSLAPPVFRHSKHSLHHTPKGLFLQQTVRNPSNLDLAFEASQTRAMAHIYIRFDFGTDEEKAQLARHKLDGWKQAFRLDKRLLYKLDRPEGAAGQAAAKPEADEKAANAGKSKTKAKASEPAKEKHALASNGKVSLLVRLYFSSYEKLSEQRWVERIPAEEPFKSASPKIIHQTDPEFEKADKQFESLD